MSLITFLIEELYYVRIASCFCYAVKLAVCFAVINIKRKLHSPNAAVQCVCKLVLPLQVKSGCEGTMATYGFPWPSMLDCDKFPLDNDMCIASQSERSGAGSEGGSSKDSTGENHGGDDEEGRTEEKYITCLIL